MKTFVITVLVICAFALVFWPVIASGDPEARGTRLVIFCWPAGAACALAAVMIYLVK